MASFTELQLADNPISLRPRLSYPCTAHDHSPETTTTNVCQRSPPQWVWFHFFVNDLEERMENTPSSLVDAAEGGRTASILEERCRIQPLGWVRQMIQRGKKKKKNKMKFARNKIRKEHHTCPEDKDSTGRAQKKQRNQEKTIASKSWEIIVLLLWVLVSKFL